MKKPVKKAKAKRKPSIPKSAIRNPKSKSLLFEVADLRLRLSEAEETLSAIRKGEVDALVVLGPRGEQVYTLKGAEQPYRILVESINEGALSLTANGAVINCNKGFSKISGKPCGALIGTPLRDLVPEKDRGKFDALWQRVADEEVKTELELELNGRVVPVYISLSARMCDGECWVFAVVTDITERKRTEAELAEYRLHLERMVNEQTQRLRAVNEELQTANEELLTTNDELFARTAEFEAIINSMSDAVIYTDTKHGVLLVNPAVTSVFGYSQDDLAGKTIEVLYADKGDFKRMQRERYDLAAKNNQPAYEMRCRRKDGTVFVCETRDAIVRTPQGEPLGFISMYRDITRRKQDEVDFRKINEELRRHVVWLQEANKEIETFSYSVSHDLRAPLRFIAGFSEAILADEANRLSDASKDYFNRVRAAVEKMGHLINGLLSLSQSTRRELKRTRTDLSAAARAVIEGLRRSHPGRQVEFVVQDNLTAEGDPHMLEDVISNLLQNAWKFTSKTENVRIEFGMIEGKPPLTPALSPEGRGDSAIRNPQSEIIYFVRDNGAGFDMAYKKKLFGAFQRLHTTEEFPGIGIGLATVQRIIRRHGGKVWAEGEVGKGAVFYFTL